MADNTHGKLKHYKVVTGSPVTLEAGVSLVSCTLADPAAAGVGTNMTIVGYDDSGTAVDRVTMEVLKGFATHYWGDCYPLEFRNKKSADTEMMIATVTGAGVGHLYTF